MANDPYFSKVASLLPFDTEPADVDPYWASLVGHAGLTKAVEVELSSTAAVEYGSPVIGYAGGERCMVLDGASAVYFTVPSLNVAHTVELDFYVTSLANQGILDMSQGWLASTYSCLAIQNGQWCIAEQYTSIGLFGTVTLGWHRLTIQCDGSFTSVYVDGVRVCFVATSFTWGSITYFTIGHTVFNVNAYSAAGAGVKNVRIYRGVVTRSGATFEVPAPVVGVAADATGALWFEGGAPVIEGSALYLNGSSYLYRNGVSFGAADFTIEGWFEIGSSIDWPRLFNQAGANTGVFWLNLSNERRLCLVVSATSMTVGTRVVGPTTVDTGPHHVALVRKGNAMCVFLDGVAELAVPVYGSLSTLNRFAIGTVADNLGGASNYIGTIDDLRVTIGKARYDFTLEPNFFDTVFIERPNGTSYPFTNNNRNKLVTQGNAVAILEADPFGGTDYMLRLNGTSSYASIPTHADFNFGTGDFTIEWWGKNATAGLAQCVISSSSATYTTAGAAAIYQSGDHVRLFSNENGNPVVMVSGVYLNAWHHFVIERVGGVARIYVDGVLSASAACASAINFASASVTYFGRSGWSTTEYYNGDITDLRVTKGVARYNADFTPSRIVEVTGSFTPPPIGSLPTAATAVSGLVRESDGSPRSCKVLAYSHATGQFIGAAVSDPSTGAFYIASPERCFCVCLDDDVSARNALIYDRLDPV